MTKYELKYIDAETEMVETIEFEAEEEDVKWQLGENAQKFFTIDTADAYIALPMTDVKFIQKLK